MKTMLITRTLALVAIGAFLSGCSGSGVAPQTTPATGNATNTNPQSAQGRVAIHVKITSSSGSLSNARSAQFVSPSTNGVLVQVYTSPEASNPTPIGTSATDVSPGSTACGGATGTRTCTIYIPAPAGTDDFVFTSYDQAPIVGTTTFASNANILSIGRVTQTITLAATNVVNVALGGVIANLTVAPFSTSVIAGAAANYTLAITASDADGNAIIAGATDPYNNPIGVSITETGGSGFTSATLAGPTGTGSNSVQLTQSTQTVTVLYTGGGAPGYSAKISVASAGATTMSVSLNPFFVNSTSPYYTPATYALAFSAPGQSAQITLAEVGFSGTFTATPGATCTNIASASVPSAGAASSSTLTAGNNSGSCTVTFSDGTLTVPVTVTNQFASSTITIPGSSAFRVTTLSDTGAGSLRAALAAATPGTTITFAVTGTIRLASALSIGSGVTISGPGAANITIDGDGTDRVFTTSGIVPSSLSGVTIDGGAGGGIVIGSGTTLNLDGIVVTGNSSSSSLSGAGVFVIGTSTVTRSTFSNNYLSGGFGAAIFNAGNLSVTSSTFTNNAMDGGFGSSIYSNSGTLSVTNCTFYGNTSQAFTGGVFVNGGQATVLLSTFDNNTGLGSDLFSNSTGTLSIGQTISTGSIETSNGGGLTSLDYNVLSAPMIAVNGSTVTGTFANTVYPSNFNLDVLANNGGATQTVMLLPGSPAIGLIPQNVCAASTDQRGTSRGAGACDAGAYQR